MRSDLAVKWLSLISIKSEQVKYALWLNVYHIRCTLAVPHPSIKGSDRQSHKTVSTNHNLFEENGEPKRYRTEVLPLTNLTPYR